MVKRILAPDPGRAAGSSVVREPALAGDAPAGALPSPRETSAGRFIDFAKVAGQIQSESLEQVGELVHNSPTETVAVLRNWINER